ncbi:ComF family protein [Colwellia psychrerythraea]|uniref:Phosphoribosyltransferase n=1 Tax=Colwellia psychrerythraea TaxID=28229 RepID=A0A099KSQ1_COLPS|nr:ComF family protein [Colwellia psychrerythraea]KGJ92658.1 phosphoribosyltransferase [Colwellia psychrerythraea]
MAWKLELNTFKRYFIDTFKNISCCDLCGANVNTSYLLGYSLSQALVCQSCINDLPYFNQNLITGNLLSWPAIHRALPNIYFDNLFALSPYIYPFNKWLAQMKYLGRFELADLFSSLLCAQWQASVINQAISPIDIVLSVPLHVKKWQTRGYNQAHLIAKSFASELSLPYDENMLIRIKNNDSQMGKTGSQRRKNLANAFVLRSGLASHVKHVLLVDDVVTTGTTASEISKILKQNGVKTVTLVTVCLALPNRTKHVVAVS